MVRKLIIIGAGGDGRNVSEMLDLMPNEWELAGFLDDDKEKESAIINGVPVLGKTSDVFQFKGYNFVVLIGNPKTLFNKKKLIQNLKIKPEQLATLIHPQSSISKNAKIGAGSVVLSGAAVMNSVHIGRYCYVASNVNIGHDTIIEDYTFVGPLVGLPGNVNVEQGAYLGISSCIKGGVKIGKWAVVGMGSVVTEDVSPYHVVAGNPARVIRKLNPADFEL